MRQLSKSKLMAFRQCPKRLWLEVHRPELREDSSATQSSFADGFKVGKLAQELYDPQGLGVALDPYQEGWQQAFDRTKVLVEGNQPIFEAAFSIEGALALADVMLPVHSGSQKAWRMVEVKSSTRVKDYHRDDIAIQTYVAKHAGVNLQSVALAHVDSSWVYPGGGDYQGILVEQDLTREALDRTAEVKEWIDQAQRVAMLSEPPRVEMGSQCSSPYDCGFRNHCGADLPVAEYPVNWLPRVQRNDLRRFLDTPGVLDLRDVPDVLLNQSQLRVKQVTLSGEPYWNQADAGALLLEQKADQAPAWFLDFETIQFAVPIWKGTRPYQLIPFQFSCHHIDREGELRHYEFLDISGQDPSEALGKALIACCGQDGPVFSYNAGFEKTRIRELGERFPSLQPALSLQIERIVDLHPIALKTYYHPTQEGSWSIKRVLPAMFPAELDLDYENLEGVQDGGGAMSTYLEAVAPETSNERRADIERQLRKYCFLDTYAMVRIWNVFRGQEKVKDSS